MTEQAKAALRVYMKEWRRKNKDKVKSYNQSYWERRAEKMMVQEDAMNGTISENIRS